MKLILRWVLALGVAGFVSGYVGPIVLDPDANQGPLVGIFITGPGGALAGLVLGALFALLPVSDLVRRRALMASCAVLVLGTLWYVLPGPRVRGYLLEANITRCLAPRELQTAAFDHWDERIAHVTWAQPRAGWKTQADALFARPDGVVLDLDVRSRRAVLVHRRPWDRGRITIADVPGAGDVTRAFARHAGGSCAAYPPGPIRLYYETTWDPRPGPWPPDDLPGLLGLVVAGPAPAAYLGGSSSG